MNEIEALEAERSRAVRLPRVDPREIFARAAVDQILDSATKARWTRMFGFVEILTADAAAAVLAIEAGSGIIVAAFAAAVLHTMATLVVCARS